MDTKNLTPNERYELVLECRRSGLSDHQWLKENNIPSSTFYYWISQFKKKGYPDIPEPLKQTSVHKTQSQEVVKVKVMPDAVPIDQNDPAPITRSNVDPVMEIISGGTVIRLTNGTDPRLLQTVLSCLGGLS